MTRRRFDLTNAVGWVMVGFAFTLAVVGFLGLLKYWPLPTLAGCVLAVSHGLVWWLTGRNLRAELEAARERLMTFNGSESREALAEVGPIVPRLSGEQPAVARTVELFDQDALAELRTEAIDLNRWADGLSLDSTVEHLGQACGWSEDGETDCGDPAEGWTRWPDGTVVWLCAGHFQWVRQDVEDDGPETLPRVLPEGQVSD